MQAGRRYFMAEITLPYQPIFDVFPGLSGLVLARQATWPMRGTGAGTSTETILPGGRSCPAT